MPRGIKLTHRPSEPVEITAKTMIELIELSKTEEFDVIGNILTPEAAEIALSRNVNNRPLSEKNVSRLINQIENGNWGISNDMIVFSNGSKPYMLNGQNRCTACIESGHPILVDLRFGVNPMAFLQMDKGITRSIADDLYVHARQNGYSGIEKHHAFIARATRFLIGYFEYDCDFRNRIDSEHVIQMATERFYPMVDYIDEAKIMQRTWGGSIHEYCAVRYMMSKSNEQAARQLWNQICSKTFLPVEGSPPLDVIRRFNDIMGMNNRHERAAVMIIAFNRTIGAAKGGLNTIIQYPRYTAGTYPRVLKRDGSPVTLDDFPRLTKKELRNKKAA